MADREVGGTGPGVDTPGMFSAIPYVFVSYRRDDVPDATDRLAASLFDRFGRDHVFVDVDSIEIGSDFSQVVSDWIAQCDVLLAVIGRDWLDASDDHGRRRLDNPGDYVRLEIEAGLDGDTRVVPVLIHGAILPKPTELPETLVPLLDRQAVQLSRPHWELDVDQLVSAIERVAAQRAARQAAEQRRNDEALGAPLTAEPLHDTEAEVPPQRDVDADEQAEPDLATTATLDRETPADGSEPEPAPPAGRRPAWILAAVAAVLVAGVVAVIALTSGSSSSARGWEQVTSLPTPLEGAAVAAYHGQVWVAGGCANATGGCGHAHDVKLVYHYNPQTRQWKAGPSLPAAVNHPAMVSDGAHLYVLGGFGADGQAVATVFRLDSPSGTWQTDTPSLPGPRGAGAAAWDGQRMVFAGGGEGGGTPVRGDVWALTGNRWTTIGRLQQPRKHLAAASDGQGTVWFMGGKDAAGNPSPLVDVVSGHAVRRGKPMTAVTGNAAVAVGSGFCTLTGSSDEGLTGAVQCQPSRSLPALDPPRDYVGAAVLDGKVYVVGGFDAGHKGGIRTVESLDIAHAQ